MTCLVYICTYESGAVEQMLVYLECVCVFVTSPSTNSRLSRFDNITTTATAVELLLRILLSHSNEPLNAFQEEKKIKRQKIRR